MNDDNEPITPEWLHSADGPFANTNGTPTVSAFDGRTILRLQAKIIESVKNGPDAVLLFLDVKDLSHIKTRGELRAIWTALTKSAPWTGAS